MKKRKIKKNRKKKEEHMITEADEIAEKIESDDKVQEKKTDDIPESKEDTLENKASVDEEKEIQAKLEAAQQEVKENYDRLLRLSAEFENYKKRSAREMEGFKKFANEALIKEMLPVLDNLERAIESSGDTKEAVNGVLEGVEMTLKEILKIFEKFKVTQIDAIGKPFDPCFHEAVLQEESDEHETNTVLKEFQRGYLIHDRLLRPAMVVVSKAAEKSSDEELKE